MIISPDFRLGNKITTTYIEYRETTEGGAIIFKADWADMSDNKLPVDD